MARKTSRGRQRITMEKMKNQNSLQVTFSKRRSGIMKKCNELSTLTGAEMAVVIFSPGKKAFSFGNPSIQTILNRFQNLQIPNKDHVTEGSYQLHQEVKLKDLTEKIDLLKEEHEAERKLKQLIDQISETEEKNNHLCLEASVENLNEAQLEKLEAAFQELNKMAEKKMKTQNINLEIQRVPSFQFQNVFEHPHDAPSGGYMPNFANYAASKNVFGLFSQAYGTWPSAFGGGGFHFIQGEASSISINNGVPVAGPAVGSFVLPHYAPIQGYLPLF